MQVNLNGRMEQFLVILHESGPVAVRGADLALLSAMLRDQRGLGAVNGRGGRREGASVSGQGKSGEGADFIRLGIERVDGLFQRENLLIGEFEFIKRLIVGDDP